MNIHADPARLKAFLADPARASGTLRYHELQGFLFAIAGAPELVRPSEWIPEVFGGAEAEYASLEEARIVLGAIMALYNEINHGILICKFALPADCAFREPVLANLETDAPVSLWSRGFSQGYQWLEETWDAHIPDDLDEDFGAILMTLSFFASRRFAERLMAETDKSDLEAFATTTARLFPDALESYAVLGRTIADAHRAAEQEPVRAAATPGRNDACPCGSGKKYKKCCGLTR